MIIFILDLETPINLGVLQRPQAPTCLRPWVATVTVSSKDLGNASLTERLKACNFYSKNWTSNTLEKTYGMYATTL